MPRVSNILLNYHVALSSLARYYYERKQTQKVLKIVDFMQKHMKIKVLPVAENIIGSIEKNLMKQ